MPHRLDFRTNLIVDANNPVLILKAWRDHDTQGRAYLGAPHGEDALHVERLSLARFNEDTREATGESGARRQNRPGHLRPLRTAGGDALLGLSIRTARPRPSRY